jgi:hypothetical protein
MHIMHKIILLCGLAFFGLTLTAMPPAGAAAEKFDCPVPLWPETSARLPEIKLLLPNGNAWPIPTGSMRLSIRSGGTACQKA